MQFTCFWLLPLAALGALIAATDEDRGRLFLHQLNKEALVECRRATQAEWNYITNITDETKEKKFEASTSYAKFQKGQWEKLTQFDWQNFQDPDLRRSFKLLSVLGTDALPEDKQRRFQEVVSEMEKIYSTGKICAYNSTRCDLVIEPDIKEIFEKSRDPDELSYTWIQFRESTSKKMRDLYQEYIQLNNEAAQLNNFTSATEYWLDGYETHNFRQQVEELWQQLRPLYFQLHTYVRRKLREQYGDHVVSQHGPIPAHLLGYLDSEVWGNLLSITVPYPDRPSLDVTNAMKEQGYTPLGMYKASEEFFKSLNLSGMPPEFWHYSLFEKPEGRDIVCHAQAWDFCLGSDVRIKQCTRVTMQDLVTAHHEMGHIQYFLQYRQQPFVYRNGANPGFHEAIGDVLALSVSTPKHLQILGLLDSEVDQGMEGEINHLFAMALRKLPLMAYAVALDSWRWDVFSRKVDEKQYNCHYWKLREVYQGIKPPVTRTESDFDPGAKYHVAAGVPYIRYYVSAVIQFQFHRALCEKAGEFVPGDSSKPLHKCDIYKSTEAGNLLGRMLKMGSSKPWPDAMEVVTGQREMDASAVREYFRPLEEWLLKENARKGDHVGWRNDCSQVHDRTTAQEMRPEVAKQDHTDSFWSDFYKDLGRNV